MHCADAYRPARRSGVSRFRLLPCPPPPPLPLSPSSASEPALPPPPPSPALYTISWRRAYSGSGGREIFQYFKQLVLIFVAQVCFESITLGLEMEATASHLPESTFPRMRGKYKSVLKASKHRRRPRGIQQGIQQKPLFLVLASSFQLVEQSKKLPGNK